MLGRVDDIAIWDVGGVQPTFMNVANTVLRVQLITLLQRSGWKESGRRSMLG